MILTFEEIFWRAALSDSESSQSTATFIAFVLQTFPISSSTWAQSSKISITYILLLKSYFIIQVTLTHKVIQQMEEMMDGERGLLVQAHSQCFLHYSKRNTSMQRGILRYFELDVRIHYLPPPPQNRDSSFFLPIYFCHLLKLQWTRGNNWE